MPFATAGDAVILPRPPVIHACAPVRRSKAASMPDSVPVITVRPTTTGVPSIAPPGVAVQTGCSDAARCAVNVAPAVWPSRLRSPRNIGQSDRDGDVLGVAVDDDAHEPTMSRAASAAAARAVKHRPARTIRASIFMAMARAAG